MAASPEKMIHEIVALLASNSPEQQIAAAIVLGEVGSGAASADHAQVIDGLIAAAGGGHPAVQRHAVEALGRLGAKRALPAIAPLWAARDEGLRAAAISAAVALKDDAVALVRARLAATGDGLERRSLEEILGRVGGKDAFSALLGALDTPDSDAARTATLAVRQRIKDASARERAGYLAQIEKLLAAKKPVPPAGKIAAALKILGYLGDGAAVPRLLGFAKDPRAGEAVRQEALIALRFTSSGTAGPRVAAALLEVAEKEPATLARTALLSLGSVAIPPALAGRLGALARTAEPERARLAVDRLSQMPGAEAGAELARVLTRTGDRAIAEAAATALGGRPDAARALAGALLEVEDAARIPFLSKLLLPRATELASGSATDKKLTRALVGAALARAADAGPEAQALFQLGRALDAEAIAKGLRAAVGASQRGKARGAPEADPKLVILRRLGHSPEATPEDGYALAVAELAAGRRDDALGILRQLLAQGFDVARARRGDRRLEAEDRYQIGFRLAEERHPAAEEILGDVAASGRSKMAQMAKAKLKSSGLA